MNASIERTFSTHHTHRLLFTEGVFRTGNALLAEVAGASRPGGPVKMLFVLDSGVAAAWPGLHTDIRTYCEAYSQYLTFTEVLTVPGGEVCKNSQGPLQDVLQAIDRRHICRHSLVVAIGGGAVIDMAGYAAAIAHRGVGLIRIPTTVLAQNDAAVGVKNGINLFGKKNFIGTFALPLAIIDDREFLQTLDDRDWIAGTAEAVKVALIRDAAFFATLETDAGALRRREQQAMDRLIYRCAELHIDHIVSGGDPFETGSSRPLDFGHWAAHKLEHLTGYTLRHGEAVAIGMALDVIYSAKIGMLPGPDKDRILQLLIKLGFTLAIPVDLPGGPEALLDGLEEFREHLGGKLTITLLEGLGRKRDVHQIDRAVMEEAIAGLVPPVNHNTRI